MPIKDLQPKQGNVEVIADVTAKDEVRTFNKFGKEGRVCNAKIKDDTGEMKLTLWNEQIDQVNVGDKVHITNGYVNEYQGEMQLTTGKFGKLEVVGAGEAPAAPAASEASDVEKDLEDEGTDDVVDEESGVIEEEKVE